MIVVFHYWGTCCCCCDGTNLLFGHTSLYCTNGKFGVAGGHTDIVIQNKPKDNEIAADPFDTYLKVEQRYGKIIGMAAIPSAEDGKRSNDSESQIESPFSLSEEKIFSWAKTSREDLDCADVVYKALKRAGAEYLGVPDRALWRTLHTPGNALLYAKAIAQKCGLMDRITEEKYKAMCRSAGFYDEARSTHMYEAI